MFFCKNVFSILILLFFTQVTILFSFKTDDKCSSNNNCDGTHRKNPLEDTCSLFFIIILGTVLFLVLLGIIKGITGLFICDYIGIYGLTLLVDLPIPLEKYEESELRDRDVKYDIGGWPIHPDTGERSVRVLPRRTEFCLNLIFFLAYPLSLCCNICAYCCGIKEDKGDKDDYLASIQVIKFMDYEHYNSPYQQNENRANSKDDELEELFGDYDGDEETDTQYVVNMLQSSRNSMMQLYHEQNENPYQYYQ